MKGIREDVVVHRLGVNLTMNFKEQRLRIFSTEKEVAIKQEIDKFLSAVIIMDAGFTTWLANVVLVKKPNRKWRLYVDFMDLNLACPKDSYLLPQIDKLVDSVAGHTTLSFLDAYSGYHQIKMVEEDIPKTTFQAAGGTYCYTKMPFWLKNNGATYQRMINKVFKGQLGDSLEAYIDDMVIKSRKRKHVDDLQQTFANLRANNMVLNPAKCVFGVAAGKFLGFMLSQRGIEATPEKIKALMDMAKPTCIKEVQ